MIEVNVKADLKAATAQLNRLQRQIVPRAARNALSDTARDARYHARVEMNRRLHKPVKYSLNAVRFRKASYQALMSQVYISTDGHKGTPPVKYLDDVIVGKPRNLKAGEKLLRRAGVLPAGMHVAVLPKYRDSHGNIRKGIMQQILSNLQAYRVLGVRDQNTPAMRKQGAKWVKAAKFFVIPNAGIYHRVNGKLDMVLSFNRPIRIPKKYPFKTIVASRAKARFPYYIRKEVAYHLARGGGR